MSEHHSNSDNDDILSIKEIEKKVSNNTEYSEQLTKIIKSKGKLVVYLSIIYGAIIVAGFIYFLIV